VLLSIELVLYRGDEREHTAKNSFDDSNPAIIVAIAFSSLPNTGS
jgi:hypothetical protein